MRAELSHHKVVEDGRPVDVIEAAIVVTGALDAEQVARLEQIAGRCPLARTLKGGGTRISETLTLSA